MKQDFSDQDLEQHVYEWLPYLTEHLSVFTLIGQFIKKVCNSSSVAAQFISLIYQWKGATTEPGLGYQVPWPKMFGNLFGGQGIFYDIIAC